MAGDAGLRPRAELRRGRRRALRRRTARRRGGRRRVPGAAGRRRPRAGAGDRHRPDRPAAGGARRPRRRHRPVGRRWSRSCASKPGGDRSRVTIGDFADVPVEGTYRLVYVVFNTLFNLLTQDDQVRCFENVAAHLDDDGSFVVEALCRRTCTGCATTSTSTPRRSRSTGQARRRPPRSRRRSCWTRATYRLSRDGVRLYPDRHPVRVAQRARPDGAHRRAAAGRALRRLEPASRSGPTAACTCPSTDAEALDRRPPDQYRHSKLDHVPRGERWPPDRRSPSMHGGRTSRARPLRPRGRACAPSATAICASRSSSPGA